MSDRAPNRVREHREARELTQSALGELAGLTRQSIHAVEAGRSVPSVAVALRLARALGCPVEELFASEAPDQELACEPCGDVATGRAALSHIAGRWVAHGLGREGLGHAADALVVRSRRGVVAAHLLRPSSELHDNIVIQGCSAALGLLGDRLNARRGAGRFLWLPGSSTRALDTLAKRQAHVAGVHLVDAKTGEPNVPDVKKRVKGRHLVLVALAEWELGLVVARGNPLRLSGVSELGRRGLRLVLRETGSGARRLLEQELERVGVAISLAGSAPLTASGHLEVAQLVALGAGDVGVATRDAALAFGLGFIPLQAERYDLVLEREALDDPRVARLLDSMTSAPFRRELDALGYDTTLTGKRMAELQAA